MYICQMFAAQKDVKEGAYWGTVVGVYTGMEHGIKRARGTSYWADKEATRSRPTTALSMGNALLWCLKQVELE
ncbi:hypothetical protein SOVF_120260 [Spinacia oleracea]|nr:hypothetical protein SOVF_120260 [Spinacia oleracea]